MSAIQPSAAGLTAGPFSHTRYTIKRPFFTLFGRKFHIYANGQLVLFVRHKVFTFKDEWNVFADDSEKVSLLRVKARQAIALNIVTDIFDSASGEKVGSVRNKGLKSIVSDTWEVLDGADAVVGGFAEDSNGLLRRFLPFLLGHWHMDLNGGVVAKVDQVWRFFTKEFTLEITGKVDPRFALGCAMLALMREITREQQST